jgi:hypothetical protein
VNVASACKSLDMTDFVGELAGSFGLAIRGNTTFGSGMTNNWTGDLSLTGIITTNTKVIKGRLWNINNTSGISLGDDFNSINSMYLKGTDTTFNSNNHTITCTSFNSDGTYTRTITLGSSTITCTSLDLSGTNLTFNYDTSTIILNQAATGTMAFSHGTAQFYNLTLNGFNDKVSQKLFAGNLTVNNNLSLQGNSIINRLLVKSDTTGTKRTLTAKTVDLDNVDFQDITFAGDATWSGVSVGDCGGNSGTITYTTPVTRYWVGNGGSWSNIAKWSASSDGAGNETIPLCHDTVIFDPNSITSGSQTITADMPRIGKDITFTGVANTPALSFSQNSYIFGSLTLVNGITLSGITKNLYFEGRSNANFTSGGLTIPHYLFLNNYGSTLTLQDNLMLTLDIYHYSGALNTNGKTVTIRMFTHDTLTNTKELILGSSTINLSKAGNGTGNEAPWFFNTTNFTITPGASTIIINSTNAVTAKSFYGAGKTYNNLKFTGSGMPMIIVSSNTFNQLESDTTAGSNVINLTASSIQTLTKLFTNTEPTKKLTLQSTTTTPAILTSSKDQFLRYTDPNYVTFQGTGNWYFDATTGTQANCTGLITTRNFSTFNTAKNTFNETTNTLGGNTTSKY